jgi:hypothetical protein
MYKILKEARVVLNDLEATLEKAKAIWNQIDTDNPQVSDTHNNEWQKKKARCWLHGGTDLIETNELEKWLFDNPFPSNISQENAAKCVTCWEEWLELKEAYYEPFEEFVFEKPKDDETLIQFITRLANLVEKERKGARLEWRALKSFLSYLRQMPQEQVAFIEQIFPEKMGFSGKQIIRKIAPEVYPLDPETAAAILIELAEQCRFGHTNAQQGAAESLGLCWLCLTASRLRLPTQLELIHATKINAIEFGKDFPILQVPTLFGNRPVSISQRVAKFLAALAKIPSKTQRQTILHTPLRSLNRTLDRALETLRLHSLGNITYATFLSHPHHFGNHRYQPNILKSK